MTDYEDISHYLLCVFLLLSLKGTPKEKLFGMAGGVNTTGSAKGEDNEGQHDDGVPEIQSAVTSKESSDTETTNNNTLSESGTMNTDRGDENDTRRSVSVEEDEEEDPDEDSRFIPDIDDYSKDTDDLESEISLVLLEEVKAHTDNHDESDQTMTAEKLDTLEKFASLCKKEGIEILKLNRRNKWQQRYLTVSEESQCLAGLVKSLDEYPTALLWVKRFQPSQSYSLNSISNDGKGGVEFSNITSVQIETPTENSVPPKGFPKFKQSVQLNMEYSCSGVKPHSLAVGFKTQEDADFFAASVAVVQEVLESEGDKEN